MTQRLGIMGGTFDPIHLGHLRTAEEAVEAFNFNTFCFVPAADPPHKSGKTILPIEHRWKMLEIAIRDNPRFRLSAIEQKLPVPSYTIHTLQKLSEQLPQDLELYFLVGLDSFLEMDTWFRFRNLFKLARIVVVKRPGYSEDIGTFLKQKVSASYHWESSGSFFKHPHLLPVYYLKSTSMAISSTQIRRLVSQGRSVRYLVPCGVLSYITSRNLYKPRG